ncbi:MAG: TonB-dependent receptor, partial [Bacteroidales bacterium]|nr:TonB-dependent receptor [Bacteroidales bacterium]
LMEYKNQLVATGKISQSGYKIKDNVDRSYRRGVELSAGWQALKNLRFDANSTFSLNKIVHEDGSLTDLMLSPGYVGAFSASWDIIPRLNVTLTDKVVGSQYFDNSSNPDHKLPAYNVMNLAVSYDFGRFSIAAYANNLLNAKYVADAWYDYEWDECGFFPAALANGMVKLSYKL